MLKIKRTGSTPVMDVIKTNNSDGSEILYMQMPAIRATGIVEHVFSTRIGGTSRGIYSSMNLRFGHGDEDECVRENFHRMARLLGTDENHMVLSKQTHTTNIRVVTEADAGYGVVRERPYDDIDGLITNVPGLALGIFAADCVPLLFVDPVHRAIGASHSGWRGTVARMGEVTIRAMQTAYGTNPSDLICAIGPCICQNCYEISEDVALHFKAAFRGYEAEILRDDGINPKGEHKYHLDLWAANRLVLLKAGVPAAQISTTDICTNCNPELLFSHRYTKGLRGNNGVFLMLK